MEQKREGLNASPFFHLKISVPQEIIEVFLKMVSTVSGFTLQLKNPYWQNLLLKPNV